jgi:ribosomal protein S18 acetylase RimI-like enzyme
VSILLREASLDDLEQVVEVFLACWRGSYATVLPEPLVASMTDERATALWRRALNSPTGTTVVAVRDGHVLGVTRFDTAGQQGAVHSLYVSPDAQGLGLGTRLLDHATAAFVACGQRSAELWVFADNAPSIAFYGSRGWRPDGGSRVEAQFGEPELRLHKPLVTDGADDAGS